MVVSAATSAGIDDGQIRVLIVTYKRAESLNENLRTLWDGAEDPGRIRVTVLSNHPEVVIDPENNRENLRVIINETRPSNARGYLARDWNFGILDAFGDWNNSRGTMWCVLAQNDVTWVEGWDAALRNERRFDLISQPTGDQAIAMNIDAVRKVGFFDERFSVISCQEHDYLNRSALILRDRASINDDHAGDLAISSWNPIGELFTKATSSHEVESDDAPNEGFYGEELAGLLTAKWQTSSFDIFYERSRKLPALVSAARIPEEVNWYPHFWIGADPEQGPKFLADYTTISGANASQSWALGKLRRAYASLGPSRQELIHNLPGAWQLRKFFIKREAQRRNARKL